MKMFGGPWLQVEVPFENWARYRKIYKDFLHLYSLLSLLIKRNVLPGSYLLGIPLKPKKMLSKIQILKPFLSIDFNDNEDVHIFPKLSNNCTELTFSKIGDH